MKIKILFIIFIILLFLISCAKEEKIKQKIKTPTINPEDVEKVKKVQEKAQPIKVKEKLTVIDEEGRALEIKIKQE